MDLIFGAMMQNCGNPAMACPAPSSVGARLTVRPVLPPLRPASGEVRHCPLDALS